MIKIYGPLPPPFGGVSIHLIRLIPILEKNEINFEVVNQYNYSRLSYLLLLLMDLLLRRKVHLHVYHPLLIPILFILSKIYPLNLIITLHNQRYESSKYVKIWRYLLTGLRCKLIIFVSKAFYEKIAETSSSSALYLPAYIPPPIEKLKQNDRPRLICNIWTISAEKFYEYGIDIFLRVQDSFSGVESVIFLGDASAEATLHISLNKFCTSNDITNIPTVIAGKYMVGELCSRDILVRPNRQDAFGVSVQECLDLGLSALASDVCVRPSGTIICTSVIDYENEIKKLISEMATGEVACTANLSSSDQYYLTLMSVYRGWE